MSIDFTAYNELIAVTFPLIAVQCISIIPHSPITHMHFWKYCDISDIDAVTAGRCTVLVQCTTGCTAISGLYFKLHYIVFVKTIKRDKFTFSSLIFSPQLLKSGKYLVPKSFLFLKRY